MNRDNDFILGQPPNRHVIYLGIRCNGYLPWGPATDVYELVKGAVSEFPWEPKDQYWPVWFEPSPLQEDEITPLSSEQYVVKIKNTFERLYPRIIEAIEGRWGEGHWDLEDRVAKLKMRRKIYDFLRENPGATADELAALYQVHAAVVRLHLEALALARLVTFDNVPSYGVDGPAKRYTVVDIDSEAFALD